MIDYTDTQLTDEEVAIYQAYDAACAEWDNIDREMRWEEMTSVRWSSGFPSGGLKLKRPPRPHLENARE